MGGGECGLRGDFEVLYRSEKGEEIIDKGKLRGGVCGGGRIVSFIVG